MPYICKLCVPQITDYVQLLRPFTVLETEMTEIKTKTENIFDKGDVIQSFSDEMKSLKTMFATSLEDIKSLVKTEIAGLKSTPTRLATHNVNPTYRMKFCSKCKNVKKGKKIS